MRPGSGRADLGRLDGEVGVGTGLGARPWGRRRSSRRAGRWRRGRPGRYAGPMPVPRSRRGCRYTGRAPAGAAEPYGRRRSSGARDRRVVVVVVVVVEPGRAATPTGGRGPVHRGPGPRPQRSVVDVLTPWVSSSARAPVSHGPPIYATDVAYPNPMTDLPSVRRAPGRSVTCWPWPGCTGSGRCPGGWTGRLPRRPAQRRLRGPPAPPGTGPRRPARGGTGRHPPERPAGWSTGSSARASPPPSATRPTPGGSTWCSRPRAPGTPGRSSTSSMRSTVNWRRGWRRRSRGRRLGAPLRGRRRAGRGGPGRCPVRSDDSPTDGPARVRRSG